MDEIRPREPFDEIPELEGLDPIGGPSDSPEPPGRRGPSPWPLAVGLLAGGSLLVGIAYWAFFRPQPVTPPSPPTMAEMGPAPEVGAAAPAPLPALETVPVLELPRLDASDEVVRQLVAALSSRPELARWLVGEHLVRRFVAAVDNVAEGAHPRSHLSTSRLEQPFGVEEDFGEVVIAASSFARYDSLVALFESVDPQGAARLYHQLRPLIDQAYRDLGYPGRRFDDTLVAAIRHLLAAPVPPERPALTRKVASYRWADPGLEALSPAQRQLLRMGPDNVRRVQAHLRRLAASLGVPPDPL